MCILLPKMTTEEPDHATKHPDPPARHRIFQPVLWNQTIYSGSGSDFGKFSVPVSVSDPNPHPDRIQAMFI
jgi:hypothetical protein